MIPRSKILPSPWRIPSPIRLQHIRKSSTQTTPSQLQPSSAETQRKALVAARIEARERAAAEALAASRVDAARQHAALVERTRKLNSNNGSDKYIYITAIVLFLATPPIIYFWWQHRAKHMGKKKEAMLEELAVRRREFQERNLGK